MMTVLFWKEYRQHRIVWIALAFVGAASLLGLPAVMAPGGLEAHPETRSALQGLTVALAWTYGLICGALLLAGERELGTLAFLDALPGFRRQLWLAKCLAGAVLVLAQIVLLTAAAFAAHLFDNGQAAASTIGGMVCGGAYGFAWGMLFSALGRNVMNMILVSLPIQLVALLFTTLVALILGSLAAAAVGATPDEAAQMGSWEAFTAGIVFLTAPAALFGSALVFTRLDRGRLRPPKVPSLARPRKPRVAWSALFWLMWRQARGFAAGLAAFALLLSFLVLPEPLILWPVASLLVGVLCGVTAFADEQEGPFRFLGDQRLPLGRYWVVKVGLRFGIAVAAALIVLLPSLVVALAHAHDSHQLYSGRMYPLMAHMFHSALVDGGNSFAPLCPQYLFLTLWPIYGFSTGCLYGLLFRNGLASGVFALFTSFLLCAAWVPSLLGGSLHSWQVFGPPLLLLASTRLVLRPWSAGRIASWTTAVRLAPFVVLALLWVAGGLWYRVLEIPEVAPKYDLDRFVAGLPNPGDDEAGQLDRSALALLDARNDKLEADQLARPGLPPGRAALPSLWSRLRAGVVNGWPEGDFELDGWLDQLCDDDWLPKLTAAADLPGGMVEDPRRLTVASKSRKVAVTGPAALVLAGRGLQKQARNNDDGAYVEDLRIGLSLSRNLRRDSPRKVAEEGKYVEVALLVGLDRWLEKLNRRPDLMKKALEILSRHLEEASAEDDDRILVDYLIARNTLADPLDWLRDDLTQWDGYDELNNADSRTEALWVAQARMMPWEQERQARMLRVRFEGDDAQRQSLYGLWEPTIMLGSIRRLDYRRYPSVAGPWDQCRAPAIQLKLALRWYQADNGKPAEKLDELVPNYLKAIPLDPYDGKPFRYRLSKGEEILWPEEPPPPGAPPPAGAAPGMPVPAPPRTRTVPPGQGILWSVGPDKSDDGGIRQIASDSYSPPGADVIFLVPLPPKEK